jgi:hypothetical protein
VTEAPLYLQIARQLYHVGLLTHPPANRDDLEQLDTRGVDRSGLRLGLLETWEKALINGYLSPGVALSWNDRVATIEQLSVLACIGLRQDLLQVKLGDFSTLWESCGADKPPLPIVREARKRLSQSGHDFLDIKLAAIWGTQLQLVEAQGNAVRFPHSMLQAYLGSRLIAYAMADAGFRKNALDNAGRELLIALALHSRAPAKPDSGAAGKPDSKAVAKQARPRWLTRAAVGSGSSPDKPIDLRTLCAAAHKHTSGSPFNRSRSAADTTEPAGQTGIRPRRAGSRGRTLTCAAPFKWRPLTDILHRYARTRLLSVMVFPSDRVLSWLGSQAAAGSG